MQKRLIRQPFSKTGNRIEKVLDSGNEETYT
jgi:hypothetical protein